MQTNTDRQKADWSIAWGKGRAKEGQDEGIGEGQKNFWKFGNNGMFIVLIVVLASQIYTYIKTYCFKYVPFTVYHYTSIKLSLKNEKNKHFIFQTEAQGRG